MERNHLLMVLILRFARARDPAAKAVSVSVVGAC
jgi:hypothetical protein